MSLLVYQNRAVEGGKSTVYKTTKNFTPVGTIIAVMGNEAPSHYLKCDGMIYNIADYLELSNYFKAQFGESNYFGGDGLTTFAVPDLRGEFLRGTGHNPRTNQGSGSDVGAHQDATEHMYFWFSGSDYNMGKSDLESYPRNTDTEINLPSNWTAIRNGGFASGDVAKEYYTSRPTNTSVLYCISTKDIIDDEIGEIGAGGSIFNITTDESSLEGKEITASKNDYSKSATFENGEAKIEGFIETGDITISTGNGTKSITSTISLPYYGNYTTNIILYYFYEQWLASANISAENYSNLTDILYDEKAIRKLFTIHDSVDFLVNSYNKYQTEIETIINDDICAKWINLRDYALDTLYADENIAALMDEVDLYFYGELTLAPKVPTMTSNTAPSGTAFASSEYNASRAAWYLFDKNETSSNMYCSATNDTIGCYFGYEFPNNTKVCKFRLVTYDNTDGGIPSKIKIKASNDGLTWVDQSDELNIELGENIYIIKPDGAYKKWIVSVTDCVNTDVGAHNINIIELQFYASEPKGCIPNMNASNLPYGGLVGASNEHSSFPAWKAFDGSSSNDGWCINSSGTSFSDVWIYYNFIYPVNVKKVRIDGTLPDLTSITWKIQGSYDATTWTDLYTSNEQLPDGYINIDNDNYYIYYRFIYTSIQFSKSHYPGLTGLQFYGRNLKIGTSISTKNISQPAWDYVSSSGGLNYVGQAFRKDNNSGNNTYLYGPIYDLIYKFDHPMCAKYGLFFQAYQFAFQQNIPNYKYQASNDGENWTDLSQYKQVENSTNPHKELTKLENNNYYTYYRIIFDGYGYIYSNSPVIMIGGLDFFGLDYSEYDWDSNYIRHFIYDHGVELDYLNTYDTSANLNSIEKRSDELYGYAPTRNTSVRFITNNSIDLTNYSFIRCYGGNIFDNGSIGAADDDQLTTVIASSGFSFNSNPRSYAIGPYLFYVDISNINEGCYIYLSIGYGGYYTNNATFTEMWLE